MIRRLLLAVLGAMLFFGGVYMVAVSALAPTHQEALTQPRVYAYRGWQSLGLKVEQGDEVRIRAKGTWLYTPGEFHGPEGHARYPAPSFYPLPSMNTTYSYGIVPGGVLIGRIGESGEIFVVSKGTTIQAHQAGTLYLRINDDLLGDNEGWVEVNVRVEHPEEAP